MQRWGFNAKKSVSSEGFPTLSDGFPRGEGLSEWRKLAFVTRNDHVHLLVTSDNTHWYSISLTDLVQCEGVLQLDIAISLYVEKAG